MMRTFVSTFCSVALACLALIAAITLTSCGSGTVASTPPPVPTVAVVAAPSLVAPGGASTLTITASNATQVVISDNETGTTYNLAGTGGTQAVTPSATTTYTATATGAGGTASAQAVVSVGGSAAPPTVTISASPASIPAGSSSTLTVTATNATQVVITDNIDSNKYTLAGTGGKQAVAPTATTTYTATATGAGGTVTAQAAVTVTAAVGGPTVTISASPATVTAGNASTLTVAATNAMQVVITDNVDSNTYTLPGSGGAQAVTPTTTTIYTATATGAGGTATAQTVVTVTIVAPPTVTMSASPGTIIAGSSSTLTVAATNAAQVVITDNVDNNTYTLPGTGGTQAVTPATTTTYTATATGAGGIATAQAVVTVNANAGAPTVTMVASPTTIITGSSSTLTVTATNATQVVITDNIDSNTYTLGGTGGTQVVTPTTTTIYTATATGTGGTATTQATVAVSTGSSTAINHVIFMMQENRTFDTYFGMLNPYRLENGWNVGDDGNIYNVDGIDDKLTTISNVDDEGAPFSLFHTVSSCLDDMSSDWLASYGDVSRYDFSTTRPILMDGFVHTAEDYAKGGYGDGQFTDLTGQRAMAYYRDTSALGAPELNYYYFMASQFAISDRWFSPVSSKSTPNRLAVLTGGTTQGLVRDPFANDHLPTLTEESIFQELDSASPAVSWRIYYSITEGGCDESDGDCGNQTNPSLYPVTSFSDFSYSTRYLYTNPSGAACKPPTVASSVVGDASNSFCIDTTHIAPLSQFFTDSTAATLASFSYIEPAFGLNDEHPGSGQSIFTGQLHAASILNQFMTSTSWNDSVFFLSYDEGGGPYDHVPPVPGQSNLNTNIASMGFLPLGDIPDIGSIAVNADSYFPCLPSGGVATLHCDLVSVDPGAQPTDAPALQGFAAQLGFRLPNLVISPFTRKHYVSHVPMDHTAVIKFVENRFLGPSAHLTNRDAAQPDLLDFFDFVGIPWATPPAASTIPVPPSIGSTCTASSM
jgi:phospholipase C